MTVDSGATTPVMSALSLIPNVAQHEHETLLRFEKLVDFNAFVPKDPRAAITFKFVD